MLEISDERHPCSRMEEAQREGGEIRLDDPMTRLDETAAGAS